MKKIIVMMVAAFMIGSTQQVQARKWVDVLSNVLDGLSKSSSDNSTNYNSSTSNGNAVTGNAIARYKIHKPNGSKVIILDGGVKYMGCFRDGLACVGWKKGWFVIDKQGNKVFDLPSGYYPKSRLTGNDDKYSDSGYDSNRLMVYSASKKHAIIYDKTGRIVKEFEKAEDVSGFVDGVALIKNEIQEPGKWLRTTVWSYIDIDGNVLSKSMPISRDLYGRYRLFPINDGLARVWDSELKKWGFRDAKCQWVIKPTFKKAHDFFNGLAVVQNDEEKWGYIDKTGNWVILPIYSNEPGDFETLYAMVKDKSDQIHFINRLGEIVWSNSPSYNINFVRPFLKKGYAVWTYKDGSYIVDSSFKKLVKVDEDPASGSVEEYNDLYFHWRSWNSVSKLIDWNGTLLIDKVPGGSFSNGVCAVNRDQHKYYFNDKGEIIVEFKDTQF